MNDNNIKFPDGNISIAYASRVMGKEEEFIRAGITNGWLPIGYAYKKEGCERANYYISPKMFYEVTGHLWQKRYTVERQFNDAHR